MKNLIIIILIIIILGLYYYTTQTKEILNATGKSVLIQAKEVFTDTKKELEKSHPDQDSQEQASNS